MLGFVPDKSTKRNRTNSTPKQGENGNRAGQTALQGLGAGHCQPVLISLTGMSTDDFCVTFDKSFGSLDSIH